LCELSERGEININNMSLKHYFRAIEKVSI
jgi:hypothetical protein